MDDQTTEPTEIVYRNWKGETAVRRIIPIRWWFGSTQWHPEPQWLLSAIDVEKNAERDFAYDGILRLLTPFPPHFCPPASASWAGC